MNVWSGTDTISLNNIPRCAMLILSKYKLSLYDSHFSQALGMFFLS